MKIQNLDLGLIYRPFGARPIDNARVADLAKSIAEVGLINPIIVRSSKHYRGVEKVDAYDIVAGNHRYEAVRRLGWHEAPCRIIAVDALRLELVEIDENLIRCNLTPAQEAAAFARRKAIYEELHPETKAEAFKGNRHTGGLVRDNLSFTSATALATGKAKRSIERAAARGAALGDDLSAIAGTSLDKGVELDALAKAPDDERKALIARAKAGENVSARRPSSTAAEPLSDSSATEKQIAKLMTDALAAEIVDYLAATLPRDHRCFAIADELLIAPWLKDHLPGLRAGVPRLAIVGRGRIYFIEILAEGAALTDEQEEWACWCMAWGTSRLVARSLGDVRTALAHWNISARSTI
ncbi:MAG: hypothetical protein FJX45_17365 [Alphaproteobacteria bacterium]|nr:hypothetical protein [Alphaproteobacteria bacterium]